MSKTKDDIQDCKKAYFQEANKNIFKCRMSAQERTLLQDMMAKEGWSNMSAFVRYKLFGFDTEKKINNLIESGDREAIGRLLRNQVMDLANAYVYLRYRYEKDMAQLYREPGVKLEDWVKATNHWHNAFIGKINDTFTLIRKIALKLGLDEFFIDDSESTRIDLDHATKKELDALAEQMRREQISLGLPNTFD